MSGIDNRTWVLPMVGEYALMQLRDDIAGIWHPGQWGYFGGSVEPGETVEQGALRELEEEIGYHPPGPLRPLLRHVTPEYGPDAVIYSFACDLVVDYRTLPLGEGMDYDLLRLDDLLSGAKMSPRFLKSFPIIPRPFMAEVFRAALA